MIVKVVKEYQKCNYNIIVKIFGDSHCLCFVGSSQKNKYLDIEYNNNKVLVINYNQDSVSISGLNKENPKLGYNKTIIKNIEKANNVYHLFKLGQVDIEYIYYYKLFVKKDIIAKDEFYEKIIYQYLNFLQQLNVNIIICGSNLPGLTDIYSNVQYLAYIIGIDACEIPKELSLQDKCTDIINFNTKLKRICEQKNIKYFDLINESIEIKDGTFFLKDIFQEGGIHYKGGNGAVEKKLNDEMNYINNPKYKYTYHTFLKKLLDTVLE